MKISSFFLYVFVPATFIRKSDGYETVTSHGSNDSSPSYHIETLVVSEFSMQEYHKEDVTSYLATLIQLVNEIFKSETLNLNLSVSITAMIVLEESESSNMIVENNKMRSLQRSCYLATRQMDDDDATNDLVLVITRKNFGDVVGYSPGNGMCDGRRSCSLIQDIGYRTAFIIAHEIGHLFGLLHDDDCYQGASESSVMAITVKSTFSTYYWTNCSQSHLSDTISEFSCLNNKPSFNNATDDGCGRVVGMNSTVCPWYTYVDDSCASGVCVIIKNYSKENVTAITPATTSSSAMAHPSTRSPHNTSSPVDTTPVGAVTVAPDPQPGYSWVRAGWTRCSSPCGGGATYQEYQCKKLSDNSASAERYCNRDGYKPRAKECNTHPCGPVHNDRTFAWKTGRWSECRAKKCGSKGKQTRSVKCIRSVNGKKKSVNKSSCNNIGEIPATKKSCRSTCR